MRYDQRFIEEYKEVGANMRHYGNMRFAQLTLYLAVNGVLMNLVVTQQNLIIVTVFGVLGLFSTFVFFILEKRSTHYWGFYKDRARDLEKLLGITQYSRSNKKTVFNATNAIAVFYLMLSIMWILLIIFKPISL